ncbi:hypothetical protein A5N75_11980 [Prescottella equi]|nr:hypothetical protein A6F56_15800 [Prescottella equi]ORL06921.1 hypothetical protein A6I84_14945 [Prescottella equi]ORL76074.1 hypothetical protein A5N75_11980 [Prescottella equi]
MMVRVVFVTIPSGRLGWTIRRSSRCGGDELSSDTRTACVFLVLETIAGLAGSVGLTSVALHMEITKRFLEEQFWSTP